MSDNRVDGQDYVLHIRSGSDRVVEKMEHQLGGVGLKVDSCTDVYRGLAQLISANRPKPSAVIVCVDGLSARELEFFPIVSRHRPGVPVYLYGASVGGSLSAEALELGASGVATKAVIESLGGVSSRASEIIDQEETALAESTADEAYHNGKPSGSSEDYCACEPPDMDEKETDRSVEEALLEQLDGDIEPDSIEADEPLGEQTESGPMFVAGEAEKEAADEGDVGVHTPSEPIEAEESFRGQTELDDSGEGALEDDRDDAARGAARVPWLRYEDGPVRQPPPADPVAHETELDTPLLTDEEYDALIGDDTGPRTEVERNDEEDGNDATL